MTWFKAQLSEVKTGKKTEQIADLTIDRAIGSDWSPDWFADLAGEQSARNFIDAVEALGDFDKIRLTLNSPGGDVASGIRIYNYLKNHPADVEIRVEGMAASIASVIMMAGDSRVMGIGSTVMIHNPMTYAGGYYNEAELREMADSMAVIKSGIVSAYVDGTGLTAEEVSELMDQGDTYFDAQQAIDSGFATATDETIRAVASTMEKSFFKNQIEAAGRIRDLEATIDSLEETLTARDELIRELEASIGLLKTANAGLAESQEMLEEKIAKIENPTLATAGQIIEWTASANCPQLAAKFAASKMPVEEVQKQIAIASDLMDISAAAGIDSDEILDNLENPTRIVQIVIASAMANAQQDLANQVSPTAGGKTGPSLNSVYSQLNRK